MKKIIFLGILIFSVHLAYAQESKINKTEELRIYAVSSCIQNNYEKINTEFQSKDVTNSLIVSDLLTLSEHQLKLMDQFIEEKTKDFYLPIPYQEYSISPANTICYKCIDFYNSKELKKYIKRVLKKSNE